MEQRLRLTREVHVWLDGLREHDPRRLRTVGAALTLLARGAAPGPPLVLPLEPALRGSGPWDALERFHSRRHELLQQARRALADVATSVKRIDLQREDLVSTAERLAAQAREAARRNEPELARGLCERAASVIDRLDEVAELQEQLRQRETELRAGLADFSARLDVLRLAAETARAERTAAAGFRSAHAADREAHGGRPSLPVHEEEADDFAQRARSRAAGVVRAVHGLEHGGVPDPDEGPLSELRPGAPGDDSVRILFTAGPDGSATLHEAGADEADWDRWYVTALPRARRERTSPETSAAYTEQGFLAAFFPGLEAEVAAAADELSDRRGDRALHAVRRAAGVSRSDVALRMNVATEEVAALERDGLGAADLGSLTAYAEALGGRIEVTAEFGGRKVALR